MQMYCNSNDINIQDNNVTFSNDINYRNAPYNNYSRNMSCGNLAKYSKKLKFYRGKNNLSNYDASILGKDKNVSDYFEEALEIGVEAKSAANWIITHILGYLFCFSSPLKKTP